MSTIGEQKYAEARLLVLNFIVDFALWTQFKLKNDQTKRLRALYLLTFKILARYFPEYTIEVVFLSRIVT